MDRGDNERGGGGYSSEGVPVDSAWKRYRSTLKTPGFFGIS